MTNQKTATTEPQKRKRGRPARSATSNIGGANKIITTPPATSATPAEQDKKYYFTQHHEDLIIKYKSVTSEQEKNELYKQIKPVFDEMVDKIVFTFKFNLLPNYETLKDECKFFLTTILEKFDPSKGHKAFAYFSVITKNWFIHKVKTNKKNLVKLVSYEDPSNSFESEFVNHENEYEVTREKEDFWRVLLEEIQYWDVSDFKDSDKVVLEAIKTLIEKKDEIDIVNRKGIYIYIRDMTNLQQKDIAKALTKIRKHYADFKKEYDEYGD